MTYSTINQSLFEQVGLTWHYHFAVEPYIISADSTLENPRYLSGIYDDNRFPGIFLCEGLSESGAVAVYLHEVAHKIARFAGLEYALNGTYHNKYFGVLVAVMYRRANILDKLSIYDFADTETRINGRGDDMPTNDELVERLAFILKRSKSFANSSLTIEEIAEKMWWTDYVSEILSHPDGFDWAIKELRRGGGMDEIADLLVDSRILAKNII